MTLKSYIYIYIPDYIIPLFIIQYPLTFSILFVSFLCYIQLFITVFNNQKPFRQAVFPLPQGFPDNQGAAVQSIAQKFKEKASMAILFQKPSVAFRYLKAQFLSGSPDPGLRRACYQKRILKYFRMIGYNSTYISANPITIR